MAITIEPRTEGYVDLPLTNFPVSEDYKKRMMDVPIELWSIVTQYNKYRAEGNHNAANNLIKNNPDIVDCFFNADKYNWPHDAIIAVQRFFLEEVVTFINNVAQNAVGINDSPIPEQADLVAYSAKHVDKILKEQANKYHTIRNVTLLASKWSNTYPYTQVVTVPDVTSTMDIKVVGLVRASTNTQAEDKALKKASGFLMDNDNGVGNGIMTFFALKKPEIDFTVITEGG